MIRLLMASLGRGSPTPSPPPPPPPPDPPPSGGGDGYPRIFGPRVGRRNYGNNSQGSGVNFELDQSEVDDMGLCHWSVINGQPVRGSGFQNAMKEGLVNLKAINSSTKVYQYWNQNESGKDLDGPKHDVMIINVGPPGQTVSGSSAVPTSSWYARRGSAVDGEDLYSSFGGTWVVNLTHFVVHDSQGRYFGEAFMDDHFPEYWVTPFLADPFDGYFCDVQDHRPLSDRLDYKGLNFNNNSRSGWRDGALGQEVADAYREGQARGQNRLKSNYSGAFLIGGNTASWPMESTEENPRLILNSEGQPANHPSYVGLNQMGWMERQSAPKDEGTSVCGMYTSGKRTAFGSPRMTQNNIHFLTRHLVAPKHAGNQFQMEISGDQYTHNLLVGSNITAVAMVMGRFAMAQSELCGAYTGLTPIGNAQYNVTIHIDESGLINTGTTGLSAEWLGDPLEDALDDKEWAAEAAVPWILGSNGIYKREFVNGLVIVSFDKGGNSDNTTITGSDKIPVIVGGSLSDGHLPSGVFKEFLGHQDSTINAGRVINTSNFPDGYPLRNMDARYLVRV